MRTWRKVARLLGSSVPRFRRPRPRYRGTEEPSNRFSRFVLILALIFLAGCSFFSRTKSSFYSFERIPPAAPVAARSGAPIAIDSIELPPGFDRKDVVVRKPDHQLEIRGTEQWSASLEPMVLHTLAFDLAARLPVGMVVLPGQLRPTGAVRSISVVFGEFAAGPDPNVVLDARWTIDNVPHQERITITIASLKSADVADGFSRALAALADRIAQNFQLTPAA